MWSNLLSAVIGAFIGVLGALLAANFTVRREAQQVLQAVDADHRNATRRAEEQRGHDAAGRMAVYLVAVYDTLRDLERRDADLIPADFAGLRDRVDDFRRSIVLDGPLVESSLEVSLKSTRKTIADNIPRDQAFRRPSSCMNS